MHQPNWIDSPPFQCYAGHTADGGYGGGGPGYGGYGPGDGGVLIGGEAGFWVRWWFGSGGFDAGVIIGSGGGVVVCGGGCCV